MPSTPQRSWTGSSHDSCLKTKKIEIILCCSPASTDRLINYKSFVLRTEFTLQRENYYGAAETHLTILCFPRDFFSASGIHVYTHVRGWLVICSRLFVSYLCHRRWRPKTSVPMQKVTDSSHCFLKFCICSYLRC